MDQNPVNKPFNMHVQQTDLCYHKRQSRGKRLNVQNTNLDRINNIYKNVPFIKLKTNLGKLKQKNFSSKNPDRAISLKFQRSLIKTSRRKLILFIIP